MSQSLFYYGCKMVFHLENITLERSGYLRRFISRGVDKMQTFVAPRRQSDVLIPVLLSL
jgi:hypothetical protein